MVQLLLIAAQYPSPTQGKAHKRGTKRRTALEKTGLSRPTLDGVRSAGCTPPPAPRLASGRGKSAECTPHNMTRSPRTEFHVDLGRRVSRGFFGLATYRASCASRSVSCWPRRGVSIALRLRHRARSVSVRHDRLCLTQQLPPAARRGSSVQSAGSTVKARSMPTHKWGVVY